MSKAAKNSIWVFFAKNRLSFYNCFKDENKTIEPFTRLKQIAAQDIPPINIDYKYISKETNMVRCFKDEATVKKQDPKDYRLLEEIAYTKVKIEIKKKVKFFIFYSYLNFN